MGGSSRVDSTRKIFFFNEEKYHLCSFSITGPGPASLSWLAAQQSVGPKNPFGKTTGRGVGPVFPGAPNKKY